MIIEDDGSTLVDALRAWERRLADARPRRIVLGDSSDSALAAALVASKLGISVEATPDASRSATTNGRLIAQLAGAYTPAE